MDLIVDPCIPRDWKEFQVSRTMARRDIPDRRQKSEWRREGRGEYHSQRKACEWPDQAATGRLGQ